METWTYTLTTCALYYALLPWLCTAVLQQPALLWANYRNDCIAALTLDLVPSTKPSWWRVCRYRLEHHTTTTAWRYCLPLFGHLFNHTNQQVSSRSRQYLILEWGFTSATFTILWHCGITPHGVAMLTIYHILIAIAHIDYQSQLIPDHLSLGGLWLGLLCSLIHYTLPLSEAVAAAMLGYTAPYIITAALHAFGRPRSMGHGDFKMMAMLGAWMGFMDLVYTCLIASTCCIAYFGWQHISKPTEQSSITPHTPIAFGPFLSLGAAIIFLTH